MLAWKPWARTWKFQASRRPTSRAHLKVGRELSKLLSEGPEFLPQRLNIRVTETVWWHHLLLACWQLQVCRCIFWTGTTGSRRMGQWDATMEPVRFSGLVRRWSTGGSFTSLFFRWFIAENCCVSALSLLRAAVKVWRKHLELKNSNKSFLSLSGLHTQVFSRCYCNILRYRCLWHRHLMVPNKSLVRTSETNTHLLWVTRVSSRGASSGGTHSEAWRLRSFDTAARLIHLAAAFQLHLKNTLWVFNPLCFLDSTGS